MVEVTEKQSAAKPNRILNFASGVRSEARKVTWATRKETTAMSLFVLAMAVIAAFFFMAADTVLGSAVKLLLDFTVSLAN
ncbi:MAG: preprotein translocase subunit SecE [Hyphomonadaceae bacterium]|nr:MAG: preprotein translocase subunit SecE [Hyphomonadaceae bacterium]